MITNEILKTIEQIAREVFGKLETKAQISVAQARLPDGQVDDATVSVSVTMDDPQLYIGEKGQTLFEIQHVIRAMARKKLGQAPWIALDINEYQKTKEAYLAELANAAADEAALLKKEKELPAMTARERRIIHTVISQRTDVTSESAGEEPDRKVVIRPKP
ncbi:MAG: hypothetical protein HYS52_00895 [Candidatus Wildermuthbacteria bacterium]|nr:hypothetical protein [Candidatus Wildermuthbacteria bacterium]